jgi:hypothetical protein
MNATHSYYGIIVAQNGDPASDPAHSGIGNVAKYGPGVQRVRSAQAANEDGASARGQLTLAGLPSRSVIFE